MSTHKETTTFIIKLGCILTLSVGAFSMPIVLIVQNMDDKIHSMPIIKKRRENIEKLEKKLIEGIKKDGEQIAMEYDEGEIKKRQFGSSPNDLCWIAIRSMIDKVSEGENLENLDKFGLLSPETRRIWAVLILTKENFQKVVRRERLEIAKGWFRI